MKTVLWGKWVFGMVAGLLLSGCGADAAKTESTATDNQYKLPFLQTFTCMISSRQLKIWMPLNYP